MILQILLLEISPSLKDLGITEEKSLHGWHEWTKPILVAVLFGCIVPDAASWNMKQLKEELQSQGKHCPDWSPSYKLR